MFERFEADGFAVVAPFLHATELDTLREAVAGIDAAGLRNLIGKVPEVRSFAASVAVRAVLESLLGAEARLVRSIFFNKDGERNWHVAWHQDVTIAVAERCEVAGFGAWSMKDAVPHVQAPSAVLERMATLRVHLEFAAADALPPPLAWAASV
jgi:hypothetical protein